MDKLDSKTDASTLNIMEENIDKLRELFPDVFTEGKIDFDALKETPGDYTDDRSERYSFNWNGKARARRAAAKIREELTTENTEKEKKNNPLFSKNDSSAYSVSSVVKKLDLGFKVFKLDASNIIPWDLESKT